MLLTAFTIRELARPLRMKGKKQVVDDGRGQGFLVLPEGAENVLLNPGAGRDFGGGRAPVARFP